MNIFVIPSWYPSDSNPVTGIFFREQSRLFAKRNPTDNIGISLWGQSEESFLIHAGKPFASLSKLLKFKDEDTKSNQLEQNCLEITTPALTWSRKIRQGNFSSILEVNLCNLRAFEENAGKVDIIHAHVGYPGGAIARSLSSLYGLPYIITEHQSPFPFKTFLTDQRHMISLLKRAYESSAQNVAVSMAMQSEMRSYDIPCTSVLSNFIDEALFSLTEIENPKNHILFVGRLESQKGIDVLLKAISSENLRNKSFMIIGEGSQNNLVLNAKQTLQNLSWLQSVDQSQVSEKMKHSNFLVLPSRHEGLPVTIIEAMACGLPVISTRCGGPEEMITDETGIIVEPENPEQLAKAIEYMIEHRSKYDAQKIRDHFLKNYSSKVVCQKLRKLYEKVIEEHQSKRQ